MWSCHAIGEGCWSWKAGDAPGVELSARLLACYRDLKQAPIDGIQDVVPSYTELAVHFDPLEVDPLVLRARVEDRLNRISSCPETMPEGTLHVLSVCYDGADLGRVADHTGLSVKEVIARHVRPEYTVAMIGFLPHFPYCLGLDPQLEVPRLSSPRTAVPAGSVAIAGRQTGVYPGVSPGGWNLLGRTDPARLTPLRPGDRLRFEETKGGA